MIMTKSTVISFHIPDEMQKACEFMRRNPNWIKSETSAYISFKQEAVYASACHTGEGVLNEQLYGE